MSDKNSTVAAVNVQTIDIKTVEKLNKAILSVADLTDKLEKAKTDEAALRSELGGAFAVVEVKVKRTGGGRPLGSKNKPKAKAEAATGSAPAAPEANGVAAAPSV